MRLSIAVSARNGMPYLEKCLTSILTAGEGLDVEVLYEDACSTDGSADCARRLLGAGHVNVQDDAGWGDAVNRIFRKSTGDVFGAIGADDMLAPQSLRYVARAFLDNPKARWAIGLYEIIDELDRPTRKFHNAYKNFAIRNFCRPWLMAENIIPNVSFFIRRDFREEVGDMLLERETLANDYDYFIRCVKRAKPLVIPHILGRWRYHRTSQSGRNMRRMSMDAWNVCRSHTRNPLYLAANAVCSLRNAFLFDKVG
jgi:glycosyltransferase involved in cell wall biosynthesis